MLTEFLLETLRVARPSQGHAQKDLAEKLQKELGLERVDCCGVFTPKYLSAKFLLTCHLDTVDNLCDDGLEKIVNLCCDTISLAPGQEFKCLGADDGAGVAALHWLIAEAKLPDFVACAFFFDEEVGRLGSKQFVETQVGNYNYQAVVSLDRRGTSDVITHQGGRQTCSSEFAKALAKLLGDEFAPSNQGIFTDSLSFACSVPECTNLSTGYESPHSKDETQRVGHLERLAISLASLDWLALPICREPKSD